MAHGFVHRWVRTQRFALFLVFIIGLFGCFFVRTPQALADNVASLATVSASTQSTQNGQTAAKIIDGVVSGHPQDATKEWASVQEKAGAWVRLDFQNPVDVTSIVLYDRLNTNDQVMSGTLTFSDGSTEVVGTLPNTANPGLTVSFSKKTISWVKFTVGGVSSTTQNVGLAEMEIWGIEQNQCDVTTKVNQTERFGVVATDPDIGDQVYYEINWDVRNMVSASSLQRVPAVGMVAAGVEQFVTHAWSTPGEYTVSVAAIDQQGARSPASETSVPVEVDLVCVVADVPVCTTVGDECQTSNLCPGHYNAQCVCADDIPDDGCPPKLPCIRGDLNCDRRVGVEDLSILLFHFSKDELKSFSACGLRLDSIGDISSVVDEGDISIIVSKWDTSVPAGQACPVEQENKSA